MFRNLLGMIMNLSFCYCGYLTKIIFGDNLTWCNRYAFGNCFANYAY